MHIVTWLVPGYPYAAEYVTDERHDALDKIDQLLEEGFTVAVRYYRVDNED